MISLKQAMLHSLSWKTLGSFTVQGVQFIVIIVLARLLSPDDFGLVAIAAVFVGFLSIFHGLGFGQSIVREKELHIHFLSSLFYANMILAFGLTLMLILTSSFLAQAYGDPRIETVVSALSTTFVLAALGMVPAALLQRGLAFKRLAMAEVISAIFGGTTAISLAIAGYEVWALVYGTISGLSARVVSLFVLAGWYPSLVFRWEDVRSVMSFGLNLTGFGFINYFIRKADDFIIGSFLGATALGFYSIAYKVLLFPRRALSQVLGSVLFPVYCKIQDDDARLARAHLRACAAVGFVAFPIMLGLLVIAHPFVDVVLGPKWLPSVPLLWTLAPIGMIQSILSLNGQIYFTKGRTDLQFRVGIVVGILVVGSFLVGTHWGVLGVAVAYAIADLLVMYPCLRIAYGLVPGLRVADLFRVLRPYFIAAGAMALLVATLQAVLWRSGVAVETTLVASILLGTTSYTAIVLYTHPPALDDFLNLLPTSSVLRRVMQAH